MYKKSCETLEKNEFPYCIQCTNKGEGGGSGCFLYDRIIKINTGELWAISPVFSSQVELFDYCDKAGLKPVFIID